jgi:[NiFe] hydrogenase diaphorase moiety large subunit
MVKKSSKSKAPKKALKKSVKKSVKKTSKKALPKKLSVKSSPIKNIVLKYSSDPGRLMDILLDVQASLGCITDKTIQEIAGLLNIPAAEVEQTSTFYYFFSKTPDGKYTVYLNNSVVAGFMGFKKVKKAFEDAAGIRFNRTTKDGLIGLYELSDIGMNDQEPAAIINGKVFTSLTPEKAKALVAGMKAGKTVEALAGSAYGDGQNANPLMKSMVKNNLIKKGDVIFSGYNPGEGLKKALAMTPEQVIALVKASDLKGRGGAGFSTGLKWELCKKNKGSAYYLFCNADEGEPGTFKDRVILTELPKLVFEGMAIAGYALGAKQGILYLRNEYMYMKAYLNAVLDEMRKAGLLGKSGFDIRIQFGAGAYVCGEESALIESAEGKRGEPRDRPPFPAESGYKDQPTVINNVETLASVVKIMVNGADWYKKIGVEGSCGTKVMSISGDCAKPGVYEIPWGTSIADVLKMAGAADAQAVQVGGPSGTCIGPDMFSRTLSFKDMATGGSFIVIGKNRDLLKDVVQNFMEFFVEESCGSCVPCRAMTVMYKKILKKIMAGRGVKADIESLLSWEPVMKKNRCGLGQTAMNPVVTTIKNFRSLYDAKITITDDSIRSAFDEKEAVRAYEEAVRKT